MNNVNNIYIINYINIDNYTNKYNNNLLIIIIKMDIK